MAKPDKLNKGRQDAIVKAIRGGAPHETAAALAGIATSTFYSWLQKGAEADSGKFRKFHDAVRQAEAISEALRIRRIDKAGRAGDWKADAWYLERRYPEKYGRRVISADINHSGGLSHEHEEKDEIYERLQNDPDGQELLIQLWEWEQRQKH